jgi:hypothetical protein
VVTNLRGPVDYIIIVGIGCWLLVVDMMFSDSNDELLSVSQLMHL